MTQLQRWTTALACTAVFLAVQDALGLAAAVRPLAASLHVSTAGALRGVVAAFFVAAALTLPIAAHAVERHGPRRTQIAAWLAYALGSAAGAGAPSAGWLTAARALQGVGITVAVIAARSLGRQFGADRHHPTAAENHHPAADRHPAAAHRRLTAAAATCAAALAAAPLIVSAWTTGPGWRWYFAFDATVGTAAAAVTALCVREALREARRLDFESLAVSTVGLTALVWGLIRGESVGWAAPSTITALTIGLAVLALLAKWQMPVGRRHQRTFLATHAAELLFCASLSGPLYAAAWDLRLPSAAVALVTGLIAVPVALQPLVRGMTSPQTARVLGLAVHAAGLAALSGSLQSPEAVIPLAVSAFGAGLALTAIRPNPTTRPGPTTTSATAAATATATSALGAISLAGAALGVILPIAMFPTLLAGTTSPAGTSADLHTAALAVVLRWGAAFAAIAMGATLTIPTARPVVPRLRLVEPLRDALVPQQAESPERGAVGFGDVASPRPVLTLVPRRD